MQEWQPEKVFKKADFSKRKPDEKKGQELKRITAQSQQVPVPVPVESKKPDGQIDMTRKLLIESVLLYPQEAADILRGWYWEKPGKESAVRNVPSKSRIFIILKSIPEKALQALYGYLTPTERKQMHEIRQTPHHVTASEILKVRQFFIHRLSEGSEF